MKLRGTATNNLNDVIQMLQMARKTGTLTLQREGKGDTVEQGTMIFQNGQIVDAGLGFLKGGDAFAKVSTWGACHFVFQASASTITPRPLMTPNPNTPNPNTPNPFTPRPAGNGSSPFHGLADRRETFNGLSPTPAAPYRLREAQEVLGYFDRLGLTRAHRQLFLLINGRYPIPELMRLSGHRANDFERLLADLERVGLVRR